MRKSRTYVVGYIRPTAHIPLDVQERALEPVCDRLVIEGKRDGELTGSLKLLTETLLKDTTVAVYKLRLLADPKAKNRHRSLDEAIDAIEARGGDDSPTVIWEIASDRRTDTRKSRDALIRDTRDDISKANRAEESGRPPVQYSHEQMECLRRHWFDMRHPTNLLAKRAIEAEARERKIPRIATMSTQSIYALLGKSGRDMGNPQHREKRRAAIAERRSKSVVYFIQQDFPRGPVKIGHAVDPYVRVVGIQNGNAKPLKLLGTQPGGVAREAQLHKRFAEYRMQGEWFRCSGKLAAYVANMMPPHDDNQLARLRSRRKKLLAKK